MRFKDLPIGSVSINVDVLMGDQPKDMIYKLGVEKYVTLSKRTAELSTSYSITANRRIVLI